MTGPAPGGVRMRRALDLLGRLERGALGALMIVMVLLYSGAVLLREVSPDLARNVAWVDEATRYLMVWMVFLGLGVALARGKQVAMTSFLDRFPGPARRVATTLIDAVGLSFCLYIVWIGATITLRVFGTAQSSPTLGVSTGYLYLALPIGFALLALRYAASLFGELDRRAPDIAGGGTDA